MQDSPPQEFALQFWDQQKTTNVSLAIGIIGMLVASKGSSVRIAFITPLPFRLTRFQNQETMLYARYLVELALASNAPTPLKTQVSAYLVAFPDLIPDRPCVYFPAILRSHILMSS